MDNPDKTDRKISWWNAHKPTKRRIIQLYCALLFNAHLCGFVKGEIFTGKTKAVCAPGINCYSCPGAVGSCPLGAIQNAVGSLNRNIGFYVLGIIMLYGALLGRTICGWLCPFGLIQELLHKIPTPKIKKSHVTRLLSYMKYLILIIFVIIIPAFFGLNGGIQTPGFCKFICPAGTLEGAMAMLPNNASWLSMLGPIFASKFVIMVIIGLACIFCYRSFCRFLCPLGAIYGMFNKISVIGVRVDTNRCTGCGTCVRNCRMDVKYVGDHECIHCGQCIGGCNRKAISIKGEGFTSKTAVRVLMITLLVFALIWFNFLDPAVRAEKTDTVYSSDAKTGYEIGDRLADFTVECIDGSTFHLYDNHGKVTIINLWATYCGPCVKELPYFQALKKNHTDDLEIIAIHANLTTEDVGSFVEEHGFKLHFAVDDEDETLFGIVNGSSALPQTIVLNRKGEVIYNRVGSVSPELLEQLYEQASSE